MTIRLTVSHDFDGIKPTLHPEEKQWPREKTNSKFISDSILICNSLDYILKIHRYYAILLNKMNPLRIRCLSVGHDNSSQPSGL